METKDFLEHAPCILIEYYDGTFNCIEVKNNGNAIYQIANQTSEVYFQFDDKDGDIVLVFLNTEKIKTISTILEKADEDENAGRDDAIDNGQ